MTAIAWPAPKFDKPLIATGLLTAAASLLALAIAHALGLDRPHWAAMTVWLVVQPTRGLLIERGLSRLAGTLIGSAAGVAMMQLAPSPAWLIAAMTVWIALCTGAGNLLRHLRGYAGLLAGYSGVIVALIALEQHADPIPLAKDRILCNLIGILVSLAATALFTPPTPRADLVARARRFAADSVAWSSAMLRQSPLDERGQERRLLRELALMEGEIDAAGSGSLRAYRKAQHLRDLFAALLRLMSAARTVTRRIERGDMSPDGWRDTLADGLDQAARDLRAPAPPPRLEALAESIAHLRPRLGEALDDLDLALGVVGADQPGGRPVSRSAARLIPYRDWTGAWQAAARSGLLTGAFGVLFLLTQWPPALSGLMAVAIFTCAFSRFDHPAQRLQLALGGAVLGAVLAFGAREWASDLLSGWWALALVAPVLAAGAVLLSDKRLGPVGLELCIIFMMISAPATPEHGLHASALMTAAGVLTGMVVSILAFRLLLTVDPARRASQLRRDVVRDLEHLAARRSTPDLRRWRGRSQHRVLSLVLRASSLPEPDLAIVDGALAALAVGAAILDIRTLDAEGGAAPALAALSRLSRNPAGVADRLAALAAALPSAEAETAVRLRDTAEALRSVAPFFALP